MNRFLVVILMLIPTLSWGYLEVLTSQPPPSTGTYTYSPPGDFMPDGTGFPAAGESFVDPVFGETITRVTDVYGSGWTNITYSSQRILNADNTMVFVEANDGYRIYGTDGTLLRTSGYQEPYLGNCQWHPTDPDILYTMTTSGLYQYVYSTNTSSLLINFGSTLQNGGSANFTDDTGRYFIGLVGSTPKFFDRQYSTSTPYSNAPTMSLNGGWVKMAPDGSGVVLVNGNLVWVPVNHTTKSWGSATTLANVGSSDHGDVLLDSDGNLWIIIDAQNGISITGGGGDAGIAGLYLVPVDDPASYVQCTYGTWTNVTNVSANIIGQNRDWFLVTHYLSTGGEDLSDSAPWNSWYAYRQELGLVNVKTRALRRIAHHRSRQSQTGTPYYYSVARAALSSDGTKVVFMSNMGRVSGTTIYSDIYTVTTGFDAGGDTTAPEVTISTEAQTITADSLSISGTAYDETALDYVKCRIGSAPDASNGTEMTGTTSWSGTLTGFSEGSNNVYCKSKDTSDNWSDSDIVTITYSPPDPGVSSATGVHLIGVQVQ